MAPAPAPVEVSEPFPISCVAGRYLLFDVDVISHVRRSHNICGVLVGTIPNLSQQNVFLGVPLELMPEEARVLVEGGHAHIVDDVETHRQGFQEMSRVDRLKYLAEMDRQGTEAARENMAAQEKKKDAALKKKGLKSTVETETAPNVADSTAAIESTTTAPSIADSTTSDATVHVERPGSAGYGLDTSSSVSVPSAPSESSSTAASELGSSFVDLGSIMKGSSFLNSLPSSAESEPAAAASDSRVTTLSPQTSPAASAPAAKKASKSVFAQRQYITPTTSTPPLPSPAQDVSRPLPVVPKSYPLFRFLHSRGYFFMPGLRFGCNYSVYPGDPLRYHSHFLATGLGWDEKFDLLDMVGGGRLGTGTKKAYMVGGEDPKAPKEDSVRAFSVEWASM
ncbi:SEN34 subunit of tRNA-splicing endonuclease [Didymella exigua CBS 183.55]|uniref:tRNA-intron lyase n=1 Tax=Didymella exigua CBS 183.55 TaxID=1150837 RepID=A0A6A5RNC4_9PLEO|nr:SEN34 subunit of tRNA-splicing endonuclease [Didymella exigua CBS 183.55]KAF1927836.1 SEN34 subunit of tRNA-splicing endonuclease [Didymella exigua CBS 183.55]